MDFLTFAGIKRRVVADPMPDVATIGLIAGGVLASLWKTRGEPSVAQST